MSFEANVGGVSTVGGGGYHERVFGLYDKQ